MFNFLIQFIPTVLILGILIFIHELGHFLACRWAKVKVEKFSIGFGPEILKWASGETTYALSAIPFGGFVKPAGESFAELEGKKPKKGDFLAASRFHRLIILVAGVAMNYLLAFCLLIAVFWIGQPILKAKIGGFVEGYPASLSGLKVGDDILSLNGQKITDWQQMTLLIAQNEKPSISLDVKRGTDALTIMIQPEKAEGVNAFGEKKKISRIGILPSSDHFVQKFGFLESIHHAFLTTVNVAALTYESLWRLATGRLSLKALSGPIGIMVITGSAVKMGIAALLQLTALISISLAVINLLPIPALDGGHVFFLFLGAIFRKEVSPKVQDRMTQIGFAFLMGFMILVVYNDLVNVGIVDKVRSFFGG